MEKNKLLPPPPAPRWTRIDDYFVALAKGRTARRRAARVRMRTQPEEPRPMLSTIPFLALMLALGLVAIAVAILAWPGGEHLQPHPRAEAPQPGTASANWFDEAKKEMRAR